MRGTHNENRKIPLKEKLKRMDILGTAVFLGAVCCLILALQWGGQTLPWSSSKVIGLFIGFGLLTIIFGYVQWKRGEDAIIPLRVLRQRSILFGSSFLFFFGMLNYVVCDLPNPKTPVSLLSPEYSTLSSFHSISKLFKVCQRLLAVSESFRLSYLRSSCSSLPGPSLVDGVTTCISIPFPPSETQA